MNRVLFMTSQKVAGWCHSDIDKDTANQSQDMKTALGSSRALSRVSSITDPTSSDQSESESNVLEHCLIHQAEGDPSVLSTSDDESYSETALQSKCVYSQKRKIGKVRKVRH